MKTFSYIFHEKQKENLRERQDKIVSYFVFKHSDKIIFNYGTPASCWQTSSKRRKINRKYQIDSLILNARGVHCQQDAGVPLWKIFLRLYCF